MNNLKKEVDASKYYSAIGCLVKNKECQVLPGKDIIEIFNQIANEQSLKKRQAIAKNRSIEIKSNHRVDRENLYPND